MSTFWIIGGVLFYYRREKKPSLPLIETPMVSILVPCYNEEKTIENTIKMLSNLNYPNYEIIAINDGSKDNTLGVLEELTKEYDKLRLIQLNTNAGKANALHLGLIASKGEFLGGVICPGIKISAEALYQRTAKLPRIDLTKHDVVIGRNTSVSMQSGVFHGYVGQVNHLVNRIKQEMKEDNIKVIATGGLAKFIASEAETIDEVNGRLTLEGLRLIYEKNKNDVV
jgi:cellulose synthase/poly-beta-1,6-N-acetylglucosamine synthase-like glycosyltransferase